MVKQCFLPIILFTAVIAHAQVKERGTLTLSAGPSFTTGGFGDDDVSGISSGLAKTGVSIDIGYTFRIKKNFSLAVLAHGQQNGLNTAAFENTFSRTMINNTVFFSDGTTVLPPQQGTVYPNWKFSKDHWRTASLLLGGQGQLPMGARGLYFVGKVMLGPAYVYAPKVYGESITDTATATASQNSAHAWGLGYLLGAGMRYDISSKFFITGRLDVFGTNNVTFKDVTATLTTTKGNPSSPGFSVTRSSITGHAKQTISSLNLSAGIGLRL